MERMHKYQGLNNQEVLRSRDLHGDNLIPAPERKSVFLLYLEKFNDPIIRILLVTLLLSVAISCYEYFSGLRGATVLFEPMGIFLAVILATTVSFVFEHKANKAFDVLNKFEDESEVKVIRSGNVTLVPKKDVVVEDIVIIGQGEEIPADGVLLESVSLDVNESALTGEPIAHKSVNENEFKSEATYPTNHVKRGTFVVEGHGVMEVCNVGKDTEYGKVYVAAQIDNSIKTPLNKQLDMLGRKITLISYSAATLIVAARLIIYFVNNPGFDLLSFGSYLMHTVMFAVTLIVVTVPEGIPMSVSLSLALNMKRMLRNNNLVRKMHACETMGAVTVICTDKTGTLTQNRMQVYKTNFYECESELMKSGVPELLAEGISVNSTAYLDHSEPGKVKYIGNPTEGALLSWLYQNGVDYLNIREQVPVTYQLPFSTERKYMASVVNSPLYGGKNILYVKGAPEILMGMCRNFRQGVEQDKINNLLPEYQNMAMRTLAFAFQVLEDDKSGIFDGKVVADNLTFLGVVAISDPVREDVPDAVNDCISAGIDVKIVTGDTSGTAKEIARQVGIWKGDEKDACHITGPEFASLSDEELLERVNEIKIISRARPLDKARFVKMLQQKGEVVAVTGDGTNDAPALKSAQVGLSMGDGTSVAKEASDITILDNSFASIVQAVMWGRSLYLNIQRFVMFQVTINITACIIVMIGSFIGTRPPLTVTQMLWVNLIMDTFAAMALASLPPSKDVLREKPRKSNDFIISGRMMRIIISTAVVFVVVLFGMLQYLRHTANPSIYSFELSNFMDSYFNFSSTLDNMNVYGLSEFFTIFVMLQIWNLYNAREFATAESTLTEFRQYKPFNLIILLIIVGQILIVSFGNTMFTVVPLKLHDWVLIFITTSSVLWVGEIIRRFKSRNVQPEEE